MKQSIALLSAAAVVAIATPTLLNTNYDFVEGEPSTLLFTGCNEGCTITLENGPSDDLQPFMELSGRLPLLHGVESSTTRSID